MPPGFSAISDDYAKELMEIPEYYENSEDIPEPLRGKRRRAELFSKTDPDVQKFLADQASIAAQEDKLRELRHNGIMKLAKYAGLDDAEVRAVFGEVNGG